MKIKKLINTIQTKTREGNVSGTYLPDAISKILKESDFSYFDDYINDCVDNVKEGLYLYYRDEHEYTFDEIKEVVQEEMRDVFYSMLEHHFLYLDNQPKKYLLLKENKDLSSLRKAYKKLVSCGYKVIIYYDSILRGFKKVDEIQGTAYIGHVLSDEGRTYETKIVRGLGIPYEPIDYWVNNKFL